MPVRCLVVDDSPALLESLHALLEREGLSVIATASTPDEALRQIEAERPDVALVDIDLGEHSGFDLVEEITRNHADACPATILISAHSEADFADLIAASPALGFLSKSELSAAGVRALIAA
jgi:DNA-binding NarL/FixJ family response regulator